MVTSRAAGLPLSQVGRKMSAGRLKEFGMREGTSLRGAKAAVCAAANRTSRTASCLWILSLLPPHPIPGCGHGGTHSRGREHVVVEATACNRQTE